MAEQPLNSYKLAPDLHEALYQEIKDDVLLGILPPAAEPTIVVVGGQMGAGKTGLIQVTTADLAGRTSFPAIINGDDFRAKHPDYDAIFANWPDKIAEFTDPDARVWTSRVFDEAIQRRVNIVFEATLRSHEQISNTIERLNGVGYETNVRVLAASEMLSILGIFKRYEEQVAEKGIGRWTDLGVHAEAYKGVAATLDHFQDKRLPKQIGLYLRDKTKIFETAQTEHGWSNPTLASEALRGERERDWTYIEREDYFNGWQKVCFLVDNRLARGEEVKHVKLAKELLREAEFFLEAKPPQQGQSYAGPVIAVTPRFVFQDIGRDTVIYHDRRAFSEDGVPKEGSLIRMTGMPRYSLKKLNLEIR